MKSQFFSLSLCLGALFFAPTSTMYAEAHIPFYRASENARVITLPGLSNSSFVPLTFSQYTHIHSKGIKPKKNHFTYKLEKGSYQIAFTGTFTSTQGDIALVDLGLRLGKQLIGINTNSIEVSYDNFQILNFTEVLHLDKKTTIQIVARNKAPNTSVQVLHRSMSIIKID